MKTLYHILTAFVLAALLASCSDTAPVSEPSELALSPSALGHATKGYVTGTVLGARDIVLSSYLHAQDGEDGDYLVGETFSQDGGLWRHDPKLYWPLGATLDFLAYSSSAPFHDMDVIWGRPSSAQRLMLAVDEGRTQDDILYASLWGVSNPDGPVVMEFNHAQAWVDVSLALSASATQTDVQVTAVTLGGVYLGGDLTVLNNAGAATASWNTRRFARKAAVLPGTGFYGADLTTTPTVLSILLPEQEMTTLTVDYVVAGVDKSVTYELPESGVHRNWLMGTHYTYTITFKTMLSGSAAPTLEGPSPRAWVPEEPFMTR